MSENDDNRPVNTLLTKTVVDALPGLDATPQPPTLGHLSVLSKTAPSGGDLHARYAIERLAGSGATGRVWVVRDRNLDRSVALKTLQTNPGSPATNGARIAEEAIITARLDHPHVPPVYDLEIGDDGTLYYTMKLVEGVSLGESIASWSEQPHTTPSFAKRVSLLLKVAEALEAAHARDLCHGDVKPDNVMLGKFGDVFLVDWGCARSTTTGVHGRTGTPLYMSPEIANGGVLKPLDDVYAFAATLFHSTLLRSPLIPAGSEAEFWRRKCLGAIDSPSITERHAMPRPLLATLLKALDPNPLRRHRSITDLRHDLEAWLSGEPVSALPESAFSKAQRWLKRRIWRVATVALALLAVLGPLVVWGSVRLQEIVRWGPAVIDDRFMDVDWSKRWATGYGGLEKSPLGGLQNAGEQTLLIYPHASRGAIAIEYEAEIRPGGKPGDLSAFYLPECQLPKNGPPTLGKRHLMLQFGAWDGTMSCIVDRQGVIDAQLAFSYEHPLPGRLYRVRIEIEDRDLTLLVDGKKILHHREAVALGSGYVGIYMYGSGPILRRARVFHRELPRRVSPLEVPDSALRDGLLERAEKQYAAIAEALPHDDTLGLEARFKQGLCALRLGRRTDADHIWQIFTNGKFANEVQLELANDDVNHGRDDAALARLTTINATASEQAALCWSRSIAQIRQTNTRTRLPLWLEWREREIPNETIADAAHAQALLDIGRGIDILDRLPRLVRFACQALMEANRGEDIPNRYPEARSFIEPWYWSSGQFPEWLATIGETPETKAKVALAQNRITDAQAAGGDTADMARLSAGLPMREQASNTHKGLAAVFAGDYNAAASFHLSYEQRFSILLATDRHDDVSLQANDALMVWRAKAQGALLAAVSGDTAPIHILLTQPWLAGEAYWSWPVRRARWLVLPTALAALGNPKPLDEALAIAATRRWDCQQRTWHAARYIRGEIGREAVLTQPYALFAKSDLVLYDAIRALRAGDRKAERQAWKTYLAIPWGQRDSEIDPLPNILAKSRLAAAP